MSILQPTKSALARLPNSNQLFYRSLQYLIIRLAFFKEAKPDCHTPSYLDGPSNQSVVVLNHGLWKAYQMNYL
ncbi:hypothetical protein EGR_10963 [Echinococcus granulosus]|uniref:Uncharacterized protein n=1 Tax=Echinococcus granulosus TaxID=6210 RepID=W6U127_ECHGR|nr:hypothetical protein EGR_10963 [Echinococcus granulosus]EUB54176.1 hypothetical protein EGR_10963 [Echinococcus granulosus]